MSKATPPAKWHTVYRSSEDKCFFVGKDGKSGLIRSEHNWRSTDALAKESGLSKKNTEEAIDYFCKKGIVIQHPKNPELWGYWERVGKVKDDLDPVEKDHQDRAEKQLLNNGGKKPTTQVKTGTVQGGPPGSPTTGGQPGVSLPGGLGIPGVTPTTPMPGGPSITPIKPKTTTGTGSTKPRTCGNTGIGGSVGTTKKPLTKPATTTP